MCLGRISLVNLGDNNDLVSMSSGGMLGAVKFENDLAADLRACSEAVRLDLNDLNLSDEAGDGVTGSGMSKLAMSSQSSGVKCSNGWSNTQSSAGGDDTAFPRRSGSDLWYESGVLNSSQCEAKDGALVSKDGGIVYRESLEMDRSVTDCAQSFSCSSLNRLPYSSSDSSTRPRSRSNGEPTTDAGSSESSCFHSWMSSSMDIRLSMAEPLRRRGGILGMAVTARRAATAGGIASGLWFLCARCGLRALWLLTLTDWVALTVPCRVGVRGGITTGFECTGACDDARWGSGLRVRSSFLCADATRIGV